MSERKDTECVFEVCIIGGGISGLTCAFGVRQYSDASVCIIEANDALGGRIKSKQFKVYNNADMKESCYIDVDVGAAYCHGCDRVHNEEYLKLLENCGIELNKCPVIVSDNDTCFDKMMKNIYHDYIYYDNSKKFVDVTGGFEGIQEFQRGLWLFWNIFCKCVVLH